MRLRIITIALLLFTISNLFGKSDDKIKMFTNESSPYSVMKDGKLTGMAIEILDAMFKQMKSKQSLQDVKMTNWARGYAIAQKTKNTMMFSTVRTKEREQLFKWVGPISKTTVGIVAPKRKNIKINKISDLNQYKIGAILEGIGGILLLSNGVSKNIIQHVKGGDPDVVSLKKMENNKIDMFATVVEITFAVGKANGFDMNKYEVVHVLKKTELYFAFNKNTNDDIINKWQKALDTIKANGLYGEIVKKY